MKTRAALKTMRAIEFGAGDSSVFYFDLDRETAARLPRGSLLWRRSARVMLNCANYQGSRNLVAEIERRWKAAHPT